MLQTGASKAIAAGKVGKQRVKRQTQNLLYLRLLHHNGPTMSDP
jgi:hypothetical protein